MSSSENAFSQEFCFHQNLISLKECFPGRVAISNEEFAGFLGICPATASRNRKAGQWPRTLDVGTKLAGVILLVEAARWLTTFVRTAPPEPPRQPDSIIIQLGDTILDYISLSTCMVMPCRIPFPRHSRLSEPANEGDHVITATRQREMRTGTFPTRKCDLSACVENSRKPTHDPQGKWAILHNQKKG